MKRFGHIIQYEKTGEKQVLTTTMPFATLKGAKQFCDIELPSLTVQIHRVQMNADGLVLQYFGGVFRNAGEISWHIFTRRK